MRQALALAEGALYVPSPNPRVGCVLVRDANVIGAGATQRVGSHHAEVLALKDMAAMAKNYKILAFKALPESERKNMRPALLMEKIYSEYLYMIERKGFRFKRSDIKLSLKQKLKLTR